MSDLSDWINELAGDYVEGWVGEMIADEWQKDKDRIKELRAAQQWRFPLTDPPKKHTQVIATDGEKVFMATVAQDDNWWFAGKRVSVICWKPKPELPGER